MPEDGRLNNELTLQMLHGYYASVSYIDAQIGKVLDELARLGMEENTIIVLWGDHGWHLGDHGYWTKHTNYEQANRIPLLIVAPGVSQPGKLNGSTCGVGRSLSHPGRARRFCPSRPAPSRSTGMSLVPVLKDPAVRVRDPRLRRLSARPRPT